MKIRLGGGEGRTVSCPARAPPGDSGRVGHSCLAGGFNEGLDRSLLLVGIGVGVYYQMPESKNKKQTGVHMGMSVADADKLFGPPQRVLPQFGGELRVYKAASGRQYMLIFANGELVEIQ